MIGINGILPAVKQIEAGAILATVDFNMFKIGCTATRAAVRHLKREPLPEKVMLPAEVIDKTNYKAWLVPVDQRACPEWGDVVQSNLVVPAKAENHSHRPRYRARLSKHLVLTERATRYGSLRAQGRQRVCYDPAH